MALKAILTRFYALSKSNSNSNFPSLPPLNRLLVFPKSSPISPPSRPFCNSSDPPPPPKHRNPKLVNFSLPSDSDSDSDAPPQKELDRSKNLPPPYNPFDEKPVVEDPSDPTNLPEVFAKIREDGLMSSAVKMFDGLSRDGLTHEALELFAQIKDRGQMPDVVAHTAVMEAYVDAGQAKEAHKVYLRMLRSGVLPNAYTYGVIVRGLAGSGDKKMAEAARKYVGEMVGRGLRPNAATVVAAVEGLVRAGMEAEGREMVAGLRERGVVVEEGEVRGGFKARGGGVHRVVMDILCDK